MRREFAASVGEQELDVTVEAVAEGRWRVAVGPRTHWVDARRVRQGTWSLLVTPAEPAAGAAARAIVVDLDDRAGQVAALTTAGESRLVLEDARRKRLLRTVQRGSEAAGQGEVIKAPIAGKVVKVLVAPGDQVSPGQGVIVLEAMKMENELKAARGGVVAAIHVQAGQSVDTREQLITIA
jgi:biotin carboxyl carrier protein